MHEKPKNKFISKAFYLQSKPHDIAKYLLGKVIETSFNNKITSGRIVELEVYKAPEDKGSHAYNNKRTPRTNTLFEEGGIAYVYLCYGIHHMFNFVTGPKDYAHAILLRAIEPLTGIDIMLKRRKLSTVTKQLSNGPGKAGQALGIRTTHDRQSICDTSSNIIVWDDDLTLSESAIVKSPRVGIAYAEECAHWPWRYRINDNAWTSKPDKVAY